MDEKDPHLTSQIEAEIKRSVMMRGTSDLIISKLWSLAPLLVLSTLFAVFILIIGISLSYDRTPFIVGALALVFLVVSFIIFSLLVIYPLYLMIKRRTEHFKRDHILMKGLIEYLSLRGPEENIDLTQEISTLNLIMFEAYQSEDEKSPMMYSLITLVVPVVGFFYVLYFLMRDIYTHDKRLAAFMENSQRGFDKLGYVIVIPTWKTLNERNFVMYLCLSLVFPPFAIYWIYGLIDDYNKHFKNQWIFEDQIMICIEGKYQIQSRTSPMDKQQPPPPQEMRQSCFECGGNMRYIPDYNRWYCDRCRVYK